MGIPVELQVMPTSNWLSAHTTSPNSTFLYNQRVFVKRVLAALRPAPFWSIDGLLTAKGNLAPAVIAHAEEAITAQLHAVRDVSGRAVSKNDEIT
jgi:hypothetical protein